MWLKLGTRLQYRFEGAISPVAFFQHLQHLLAPTDTLVLGCYDARPDIRRFLSTLALTPGWQRFDFIETWDVNRDVYPNGSAFHLRPDDRTLQQLVRFAESVAHHHDLCDHLAGYSSEHPLFIYHGTFWESFFVSTQIPRACVEGFSQGIGVPFEEIDFYKSYPFAGTPPDEPNA